MKKIYWISALVALFLFLVVRNIPAQWAFAFVNQPIQVSGVSGTLWQGSATTVIIPYRNSVYSLGRVDWELDPLSLLSFSPCADVKSALDRQTLKATVCAGLGGSIEVSNADIALPAATAATFAPLGMETGARGDILIRVESLEFADNQLQSLNGKGSWANASVLANGNWIGLGSVGFKASADSGVVSSELFSVSEEGLLKLDLNSTFNLANAACKLSGDIALRPGAPREIGTALAFMGTNTGGNQYRVDTDC